MDEFVSGKARPRKYRNRRIGEFFKEIDLSEKAATGISKILSELKRNGSPKPEFETDESRAYLETTIRIHDGFIASDKNGINSGAGDDLTVGMSDKMSDKMTEQEQRRACKCPVRAHPCREGEAYKRGKNQEREESFCYFPW